MALSREEELEARVRMLEARCATLEKERDHYRGKFKECALERAWIHQTMTNISMPEREKLTLYAMRYESQNKTPRKDGLTHISSSDIAGKYGLSSDAVGKSLKIHNEKGVIDRKLEKESDGKKVTTLNLVALGEVAQKNPRAIDFSVEKKWGGLRKKNKTCEHCGSEELIIHTEIICTQCGAQIKNEWKTIGENNSEENNVSDGIISEEETE